MKSVKKTLSVIGNVFLWLFVAFAVFMTILVFSSQSNKDSIPSLMGKSFVTVQSDSMNPTFKEGDLIIDKVLTSDEKKSLQKGDIITYYVDLNGDGINELNTHRIVDVYEEGGYIYYVTKGDNEKTNPINDKDPVMHPYVLAQYTGTRISGAGKVINFLQSSTGFLVVIVIPLIIFFIYELYRFIVLIAHMKGKGKLSKEEEEEIKKRAVEEYLRQQEQEKKKQQLQEDLQTLNDYLYGEDAWHGPEDARPQGGTIPREQKPSQDAANPQEKPTPQDEKDGADE